MKTICIIAALVATSINTEAQWAEIRDSRFDYLQSIHFINADTGYISGACGGNIYRTRDGGDTWDTTTSYFTMDSYTDILFTDAQTGYVSGVNFTFDYHDIGLKTTDGGNTWDTLHITDSTDLVNFPSVTFADENNGIFIGRAPFITHDGGNTFDILRTPPVADPSYFAFSDIEMLMPVHLVAAATTYIPESSMSSTGTFQILTSTDGGTNWTERYTDTALIDHLFFLDHNNGWAFTHKNLLHTTDAGNSWSKTSLPFLTADYNIAGLEFTNEMDGWLAVNELIAGSGIWNGYLYHTDDGGATWSLDYTSDSISITGISMQADGTGYLATANKVFKKEADSGTGMGTSTNLAGSIVIYPNPAHGAIRLDNSSGLNIKAIWITDIAGRMIGSFDPRTQIIDVGQFVPGLYLLQLHTEKNIITKKIAIQ